MPHPVKSNPDDIAPDDNPSLAPAANADQPTIFPNPAEASTTTNNNEISVKAVKEEVIEARRILFGDDWVDYFGDVDANEEPHGNGKVVWNNSKKYENGQRTKAHGDKYEGGFINGVFHGQGILTWGDGASYQGEWLNGKAHGTGIFSFTNGDVYKGNFEDHKINGFGSKEYN